MGKRVAGNRARNAMALTNAGLKGFVAPEGCEFVWDTDLPGFGLRTRGRPNGPWQWVYSYRLKGEGKQVKETLGKYPAMTPDAARRKAEEVAKKSNTSDDVARVRRSRQAEARAEKMRPTMARLWEEYWKAEGKLKKDADGCETLWKRHLKPFFEEMKVADVTPADVERFKASMASLPGACNRALARLSRMMTLAVRHGYRKGCAPEHPVKGVERYPENPSEFYFSEEELGRILEAADGYKTRNDRVNPGVGLAVRMLAMTGARAGEVFSAHWGQFETLPDGRVLWTVESTNTKTGRPVTRALPADLVKLLLEWKPESLAMTAAPEVVKLGAPRWVFPQIADPRLPIRSIKDAWVRIKEAAGVKEGRIHDLRHTAASMIVLRTGSLAAAQFQLGHATPLTTRRYAHLMREGMIATGDLLGGVASAAQAKAREKRKAGVVPMREAASAG